MHLVYKATYHDLQISYNWKAHIVQSNKVVCGRELGIFWDQYSNEYPSLAELFAEHDPQGICWQCRHSSRLTKREPDRVVRAAKNNNAT